MADVRAGADGGREAPAAAAGAGGGRRGGRRGGGRKPPRRDPSRVQKTAKVCHICHERGHVKRDCPELIGLNAIVERRTIQLQHQQQQQRRGSQRQRQRDRARRRAAERQQREPELEQGLQNMQLAGNAVQPQQPQGQLGAPERLNWADEMDAEEERRRQN